MIDTNLIRENIDLLKPLFQAKKDINEIRYNILMTKGLIDSSLQYSFLNLITDIEIKILNICGLKEVNKESFNRYESDLFYIIGKYNYIINHELNRRD
jgi:Na+-transporting NADH:ubiquinone oxidoreductase subunit NqrE